MSSRRQVVNTIARERTQLWIRPPLPLNRLQVVQVIGGQTVSGVDCIQYSASDPTLTTTYDPDVDTTYPVGMGRGYLMGADGTAQNRVLMRHDFAGATAPLVGGWVYICTRY